MENVHFPSLNEEGWIRPQFCNMAISDSGDGVVKTKSLWLFSTTSPKSRKVTFCQDSDWYLLDLGTHPQRGGEIFDSRMRN